MKSFIAGFIFLLVFATNQANAQRNRLDSLFMNKDTTSVLDSLMADFDDFLDSLSKPKSFFNITVGAGTGLFSFETKNSAVNYYSKVLYIKMLIKN